MDKLQILIVYFFVIYVAAKLPVTIHLQSFEDESIDFMDKDISLLFENDLDEYMDLKIIPFGNTQYNSKEEVYQCKYGEQECLLEIYQGCALINYGVRNAFSFCKCLQHHKNDIKTYVSLCSYRYSISIDILNKCLDNGYSILHYMDLARGETFPLQFTVLPVVVIDTDIYENPQNLLIPSLCREMDSSHLPAICEHYPHKQSQNNTQEPSTANLSSSIVVERRRAEREIEGPLFTGVVETIYQTSITIFMSTMSLDSTLILETLQDKVVSIPNVLPWFNIRIIPYGQMFIEDLSMNLICPQGQQECYGNIVLACIFHLIKNIYVSLPIATCLMQSHDKLSTNILKCAGNKISKYQLAYCVNNKKGKELLLENRQITLNSFPYGLPAIPTITIGDYTCTGTCPEFYDILFYQGIQKVDQWRKNEMEMHQDHYNSKHLRTRQEFPPITHDQDLIEDHLEEEEEELEEKKKISTISTTSSINTSDTTSNTKDISQENIRKYQEHLKKETDLFKQQFKESETLYNDNPFSHTYHPNPTLNSNINININTKQSIRTHESSELMNSSHMFYTQKPVRYYPTTLDSLSFIQRKLYLAKTKDYSNPSSSSMLSIQYIFDITSLYSLDILSTNYIRGLIDISDSLFFSLLPYQNIQLNNNIPSCIHQHIFMNPTDPRNIHSTKSIKTSTNLCSNLPMLLCSYMSIEHDLNRLLFLSCLKQSENSFYDSITACYQSLFNKQYTKHDIDTCIENQSYVEELKQSFIHYEHISTLYNQGIPIKDAFISQNQIVPFSLLTLNTYICDHIFLPNTPLCGNSILYSSLVSSTCNLCYDSSYVTQLSSLDTITLDVYFNIDCPASLTFILQKITWLYTQSLNQDIEISIHHYGAYSLQKVYHKQEYSNNKESSQENIHSGFEETTGNEQNIQNSKYVPICSASKGACLITQLFTCINSLYVDTKIRWTLFKCLLRYGSNAYNYISQCSTAAHIFSPDLFQCTQQSYSTYLVQEIEDVQTNQYNIQSYPYVIINGKHVDHINSFLYEFCYVLSDDYPWCKSPPVYLTKQEECTV